MIMKKLSFAACLLILILGACKKTETLEEVRLFRPVTKDALLSEGNWIKASWHPIKEAQSYTAQLSRDTFRTIIKSVTLDTNVYMFDNLDWDKLYQVQVRANATDTVFNSGMSNLGSIKTARFPTILNIPGPSELTDEAVKVSWTNGGAAVTSIKILKASDSSVVTTEALTPTDVTNQYKIISGLSSATAYIIFLYSGTSVRGWADFTTNAPLSGIIIDLRGIIGRPSVLVDTIPIIPSGSTVLLKRGQTYNVPTALGLSKAITITSGDDLAVPEPANIYITSNFNFTAGSVIDYIDFKNVSLKSDSYDSRYVFNTTASATVGRISFENCKVEIFRGVVRLQSGTTTVSNFVIKNCIVDSVKDYAVLTAGVATTKVDNISITNSTFYKLVKFISSTTAGSTSSSVLIENCTFNEAPQGGGSNYLIDYNTNNVTNGIQIRNCILGMAKYGGASMQVRGVRYNTGSTADGTGSYGTSDYLVSANPIQNITPYARPSTDIFTDPFNGNFKIKDTNFPGKSNSGDPRWRL